MNGIIHTCSHPDDGDPHFRISEEKILQDIFHYIEVLFRMIKPQKVFFMAVDGVAPRAKMNQQRGRRFRSAKEALDLETKARERGETLPTEARFDSNCITPGTVFMTNLHEQLKYFIVNKISSDKLWNKCKIILSGHEVFITLIFVMFITVGLVEKLLFVVQTFLKRSYMLKFQISEFCFFNDCIILFHSINQRFIHSNFIVILYLKF